MIKGVYFFTILLVSAALAYELPLTRDTQEVKDTILSNYFRDEESSVGAEEFANIIEEFVIGDRAFIDKRIEEVHGSEDLTEEQNDFVLNFVIANLYADHLKLEKYNRSEILETLSIEKINEYSRENGQEIIDNYLEYEIDRLGIEDPKEKERLINAILSGQDSEDL